RDFHVTGVQTCALPIYSSSPLLELRALQHFLRLLEVRRELVADRLRQERQQVVADQEQRDCGRRLESRNVETRMVTRPAPMVREIGRASCREREWVRVE